MPVFDGIIAIVEQVWAVSMLVIPVLFLGFLAAYWYRHRDAALTAVLVRSQRDLTLQYGLYVTAGCYLGGTVAYLLPDGVLLGAVIAAAFAVYAYMSEPFPEAGAATFTGKQGVYNVVWAVTPVLALAAVVGGVPVVQQVVALIFYAALFWAI